MSELRKRMFVAFGHSVAEADQSVSHIHFEFECHWKRSMFQSKLVIR